MSKIILVSTLVLVLGCNHQDSGKAGHLTSFVGNWYWFSVDTSYYELTFLETGEFWSDNYDNISTPIHSFEVKNGDIYFANGGEYFHVLDHFGDSISCVLLEDTVLLRKFYLPNSLKIRLHFDEYDRVTMFRNRLENHRILNGYGIIPKQPLDSNNVNSFGLQDDF